MVNSAFLPARLVMAALGLMLAFAALSPLETSAQKIYPKECYETETKTVIRNFQGRPVPVEVEVSERLLEECITPPDNRINSSDAYAAAAIYCTDAGVTVWDIDDLGRGTFTLLVPQETIDASAGAAAPVLLGESGGFQVYRLESGELQLNSPPDWEGKSYVFDWPGCPLP
jgi:hypothetical protein